MKGKAPRYADWLLDLVTDETARRLYCERGCLRETVLPRLNCASWSYGDIADALTANHAIRTATRDEGVKRLLVQAHDVLQAWAVTRLRRPQMSV